MLTQRADHRDVAAGEWECVTGRLEQGEGFIRALHREVLEEVGLEVQVQFVLRPTHGFRGERTPENEMVGLLFGCSTDGAAVQSGEPARRRLAETSERIR